MGATKTEHFTDEQNELAVMLKALGHPARIAIVEYLHRVDTCICGDIVEELPLAQPTVSQHLKELKQANLIKGSIDGTSICYCLNEAAFKQVAQFISQYSKVLKKKANHCC